MQNQFLFILLIIIGALFYYFLYFGGKFIFRFFIIHVEESIDYFYKTYLLKLTVKGCFWGGLLAPIFFAPVSIFRLFDSVFIHTSKNPFLDKKGDFQFVISFFTEFYINQNILLFILLCILGLIIAVLLLITLIVVYLWLASIIGMLYGIFFNVIIGLFYSILVHIKKQEFSLFTFKFDLPTFVSTGVIGFITSLVFTNANITLSAFIGIFSAIVIKYLDKVKTQVIFYFIKKAATFVLNYEKQVIIVVSILSYLALFLMGDFNFSLTHFLSFVSIVLPLSLLIKFKSKLNRYRFFTSYRDFYTEIFQDTFEYDINKLPKNLLLHFFSVLLCMFLSFAFANTNHLSSGHILFFSVITPIIVIEKFPKSWMFMIYGFFIDAFSSVPGTKDDPYLFCIHIIIWGVFGHLVIHLLNKGNNSITSRKLLSVIKWLDEEINTK